MRAAPILTVLAVLGVGVNVAPSDVARTQNMVHVLQMAIPDDSSVPSDAAKYEESTQQPRTASPTTSEPAVYFTASQQKDILRIIESARPTGSK
jgi:hypothetical protein